MALLNCCCGCVQCFLNPVPEDTEFELTFEDLIEYGGGTRPALCSGAASPSNPTIATIQPLVIPLVWSHSLQIAIGDTTCLRHVFTYEGSIAPTIYQGGGCTAATYTQTVASIAVLQGTSVLPEGAISAPLIQFDYANSSPPPWTTAYTYSSGSTTSTATDSGNFYLCDDTGEKTLNSTLGRMERISDTVIKWRRLGVQSGSLCCLSSGSTQDINVTITRTV